MPGNIYYVVRTQIYWYAVVWKTFSQAILSDGVHHFVIAIQLRCKAFRIYALCTGQKLEDWTQSINHCKTVFYFPAFCIYESFLFPLNRCPNVVIRPDQNAMKRRQGGLIVNVCVRGYKKLPWLKRWKVSSGVKLADICPQWNGRVFWSLNIIWFS